MRINWAIKQTYKIPTRFIRWSHSSSDKNPLYKKALLSLRKKKNHGNNLKLKKKEFTDKKKSEKDGEKRTWDSRKVEWPELDQTHFFSVI